MKKEVSHIFIVKANQEYKKKKKSVVDLWIWTKTLWTEDIIFQSSLSGFWDSEHKAL